MSARDLVYDNILNSTEVRSNKKVLTQTIKFTFLGIGVLYMHADN